MKCCKCSKTINEDVQSCPYCGEPVIKCSVCGYFPSFKTAVCPICSSEFDLNLVLKSALPDPAKDVDPEMTRMIAAYKAKELAESRKKQADSKKEPDPYADDSSEIDPYEADSEIHPGGEEEGGFGYGNGSGNGSRGGNSDNSAQLIKLLSAVLGVLAACVLVLIGINLLRSGSGKQQTSQTEVAEVQNQETAESAEDEFADADSASYEVSEEADSEAEEEETEAESELVVESSPEEEVYEIVHSYEFVQADVTYQEAVQRASALGGYLATVTSEAEWQEVIYTVVSQSHGDVKHAWLGAQRASSGNFVWCTGEPFEFTRWRIGEPSGYDSGDNAREDYLTMWFVNSDGEWTWNDERNDIVSALPTSSGKIGFVVEYERKEKR